MDYQLAKRGISLSGAYEVQHHATAISLVAAGVGCAILPASTFREGDRPGVCRIPLTKPVVKRSVILTRRRNSTLSPAAEAFHQLVKRLLVTTDAGVVE
jgi:DNA-binding transcriptional LysR family regulator